MSYITKYPTYVPDTPATYRDYSGGINTSLSNETLQNSELRDGLNCHYNNNALINRPGATLLKQLSLPITSRPQGDFIFSTNNNSYIISVRDGHIFYGVYPEGGVTNITMELLLISIDRKENIDDTENYIIGLETLEEIPNKLHEGFIYKFNPNTGEGDEEGEASGGNPEELIETLIIQNGRRVQGIPVNDFFLMATGTRILKIVEQKDDANSYYLYGHILPAYKPNAWEFKNIGVNNMSPFPNYHVTEVDGVPDTQIGTILLEPKEIDLTATNIICSAIVSTLTGFSKEDYYYKWEYKVNNAANWSTSLYWNASKNGGTSSKGKHTHTITKANLETNKGSALVAGDKVLIRCTLTSDFAQTYNITSGAYVKELDVEGDYVSNQAIGSYSRTHITKTVLAEYSPSISDVDREFLKMHSCTKVVADGTKAIFYDDAYKSCDWFKTVIGQYDYITYAGNLNFKTSKNERMIGVVVFDTNIVVFADNPQLGGNISVVTGNGDDYNDGQYYSPYKREIVNTGISCDAFNTIQVADNYILFKYRKDIFMLDTTSLSNTDTVKIETINDMVKQRLNNIELPLDRIREPYSNEHIDYDFHELNQCLRPEEIFSEVVDGYYGLIFPYQGFHVDTTEVPEHTEQEYAGAFPEHTGKRIENVWVRPGLRWKCYFRQGHRYQNNSKELYPWLRDVSHLFDVVSIIYIEGVPCFVRRNGDLVVFNNPSGVEYTDSNYKLRVRTKGYDMELPSLSKFLDSLNIYYNRDFNDILYMTTRVYNESGYIIYGPKNEAYITTNYGDKDQVRYGERITFDDAMTLTDLENSLKKYDSVPYIDEIDKPVMILNEYKGIEAVDGTPNEWETPVLNRPSYTSKTLTPRWRFPYLSASVEIEIPINQGFSLSSITFNFTSSDMPEFTREKLYREIISGNTLE